MENNNNNGLSSSARWQWFLSIITGVAIMVGSLMTFFIQSSNLSTIVSINGQRIQTLEQQLRESDDRASVTRAELAALRSDFKEIETKFCSADIVRNLMYASQMRIFAMLWQRTHEGEVFPTDNTYYPSVCPKD